MAKQVFVLTALLVVLMAAGRAGMYADSSLDGPIIPMPLAEASGHPDLVAKTQTPADPAGATPVPVAPTGEMVATIDVPGTAFKVLHLFQYDSDPVRPEAARDRPLSVIVWKALEVGAKVTVRDLRERIAENSALPSMTGRAVYALHPDYKLQKLALSSADIERIFALLQAGDGQGLANDAVWKGKVAKEIREVEWLDDGSHKSKKNKSKADKKKAQTSKSAKSGKSSKSLKAGKVKPTKLAHASASRKRRA